MCSQYSADAQQRLVLSLVGTHGGGLVFSESEQNFTG
jgi:hypothetical protein